MKDTEYYEKHDFRWVAKDGSRVSWKQSLTSACAYYGTFSGRWHENWFWKQLQEKLPSMSEDDCERELRQIERDADRSLAIWESFQ